MDAGILMWNKPQYVKYTTYKHNQWCRIVWFRVILINLCILWLFILAIDNVETSSIYTRKVIRTGWILKKKGKFSSEYLKLGMNIKRWTNCLCIFKTTHINNDTLFLQMKFNRNSLATMEHVNKMCLFFSFQFMLY